MLLYKYRPLNLNTLMGLINDEIYFSPPSVFNDPFDAKLFVKRFRNREEVARSYKSMFDRGAITRDQYDFMINQLDRNIAAFDDPKDLFDVETRPIENEYAEMHICAFSERYESLQMWGHYSGNHSGICIGFEFVRYPFDEKKWGFLVNDLENTLPARSEGFPVVPVLKVLYRRTPIEPIDLNIEGDLNAKYETFLRTKEIDWKYEKEWRAIFSSIESKKSLVKYPPKVIREIYFGLRTTDESIRTVRKIFDDKRALGKKVVFWRIEESDTEYRLIRKRLK